MFKKNEDKLIKNTKLNNEKNMPIIPKKQKLYKIIFEKILKYIAKNFGDSNLSVSSLAKRHNISERYLRKLFMQEIGMAPNQYIQHYRLTIANDMIVHTNLPILVISDKCGFSDQYYFSNAYFKKFGIRPSFKRLT